MPNTRRGRGKGKSKLLDRIAGEGASRPPPEQVDQGGAETEFATRASSTSSAPEEPRRREVPVEPPTNATDQDLRNAVQMLTQLEN